MSDKKKLKEFPVLESDQQAEDFVASANLEEYDFSAFKSVKFEFQKDERVQMRMPKMLLDRIKAVAKEKGIPYTRLMREILESHVGDFKSEIS